MEAGQKKNKMNFTIEEIEAIKDGLILALTQLPDMLEDQRKKFLIEYPMKQI